MDEMRRKMRIKEEDDSRSNRDERDDKSDSETYTFSYCAECGVLRSVLTVIEACDYHPIFSFPKYGTRTFWNADRPVRLLEIFDEGDKDARRRYGCGVERMGVAELAIGILVPDIETAALKIMEI